MFLKIQSLQRIYPTPQLPDFSGECRGEVGKARQSREGKGRGGQGKSEESRGECGEGKARVGVVMNMDGHAYTYTCMPMYKCAYTQHACVY